MTKFMKYLCIVVVSFWANFASAAFYYDLTIKNIEMFPNPPNSSHGYTVHLTSDLPGTGCANPSIFIVQGGSFHDETLSVLLAAMMGNKKIYVRISSCTDRPVADRVGISN
ncbi:hypothetical protein TW85_21930 [Marinomonas sp. S3726]|uniref:hypothetical protein n=1 Tax=Marinomonas sp. S3726 TaxID=579484 RepID=UPI0005FA8EF9|nr:hypothetical protein [Marinomonas sp. S3726]KJZ09601.1 hypothetical protein TW85_21930 [Marinomonas sp. S3726]